MGGNGTNEPVAKKYEAHFDGTPDVLSALSAKRETNRCFVINREIKSSRLRAQCGQEFALPALTTSSFQIEPLPHRRGAGGAGWLSLLYCPCSPRSGIRPGRNAPQPEFSRRSDRVSEDFWRRQPDGNQRIANQVSERVLNWLTLGSLAMVAKFATSERSTEFPFESFAYPPP